MMKEINSYDQSAKEREEGEQKMKLLPVVQGSKSFITSSPGPFRKIFQFIA